MRLLAVLQLPTTEKVLTWDGSKWSAPNVPSAPSSHITRFYSIDPTDFVGTGKRYDVIKYYDYEAGFLFISDEDIDTKVAAPVHLPHGATIQNIKINFYDDEVDGNIDVRLYRKPIGGAINQPIASWSSSGTPGDGSQTVPPNVNQVVDNQNYTYRLMVDMQRYAYENLSDVFKIRHRIYSIVVTYTEEVAAPAALNGSRQGGQMNVSTTAPTSPLTGMLWLDTSTGRIKQWNGSAWIVLVN